MDTQACAGLAHGAKEKGLPKKGFFPSRLPLSDGQVQSASQTMLQCVVSCEASFSQRHDSNKFSPLRFLHVGNLGNPANSPVFHDLCKRAVEICMNGGTFGKEKNVM